MESRLSDYIWVKICRYLGKIDRIRIERVSRRFKRLLLATWQNEFGFQFSQLFNNDNDFIDVRDCNILLQAILQRSGPYLRHLDLSQDHKALINCEFNPKSYKLLGRYCPQITKLNLSYCNLSNKQLYMLSENLNELKTLILIRCFDDEPKPDVGLSQLFQSLRALQYLDVSMNESITGSSFDSLNSSLEIMMLNRCTKVQSQNLTILTEKCNRLAELDLSNYTNSVLTALRNCANLQMLCLYAFEHQSGLTGVFEFLGNLRWLDLSHSHRVNDAILIEIADNCPKLEHLSIAGKYGQISDSGIRHLTSRLRNLSYLDVSWREHLTDRAIEPLTSSRSLCIFQAHMCERFSCIIMQKLLQNCPHLEHVDLTACSQITWQWLLDLTKLLQQTPPSIQSQTEAKMGHPTVTIVISGNWSPKQIDDELNKTNDRVKIKLASLE